MQNYLLTESARLCYAPAPVLFIRVLSWAAKPESFFLLYIIVGVIYCMWLRFTRYLIRLVLADRLIPITRMSLFLWVLILESINREKNMDNLQKLEYMLNHGALRHLLALADIQDINNQIETKRGVTLPPVFEMKA